MSVLPATVQPGATPGPTPQSTAAATPFASATEGPTVRVPHTPGPGALPATNSQTLQGLGNVLTPPSAKTRSSARPPTSRSRASSQGPSRRADELLDGSTTFPSAAHARPRSQTFSQTVREAGLQPTTQVSNTTLLRRYPRVPVPPPGQTWEQSYDRLQALRQDGLGITNRLFTARQRGIALEHGFKDSMADVAYTCKIAKIREQIRGLDKMYAKYGTGVPLPSKSSPSQRPRSQSQSQSRRSSKKSIRSRSLMNRGSGRISTVAREMGADALTQRSTVVPHRWNTSFSEVTEDDGRKAMRMRIRKGAAKVNDSPGQFSLDNFQGNYNETDTHLSVVIRRPPGGAVKTNRGKSQKIAKSSKSKRTDRSKTSRKTGKIDTGTSRAQSSRIGTKSRRSAMSKRSSKSVKTEATTGNEANNDGDEESKREEVETAGGTVKSRATAKSGKSAKSSKRSGALSGKSAKSSRRSRASGATGAASGVSKRTTGSSPAAGGDAEDPSAMDVAEVLNWLDGVGLGQFSDIFKKQLIDGEALMKLGSDPDSVDMKELIPDDDLRDILAEAISELSKIWEDVGSG